MTPHLTPVVQAAGLAFVSGQLAFDDGGRISGDIESQTALALGHLRDRLGESGLSLSDVVKVTVWLRRREDFGAFNDVYARTFGGHKPARSTVVSDLVLEDALVEIEAVAALDSAS